MVSGGGGEACGDVVEVALFLFYDIGAIFLDFMKALSPFSVWSQSRIDFLGYFGKALGEW